MFILASNVLRCEIVAAIARRALSIRQASEVQIFVDSRTSVAGVQLARSSSIVNTEVNIKKAINLSR